MRVAFNSPARNQFFSRNSGFLVGARGWREPGLSPRPRGGTPCDPAPFPFYSTFLNGPRRQGFASPRRLRRALDRSGPFVTSILEKGKGATAKPNPSSAPHPYAHANSPPSCNQQRLGRCSLASLRLGIATK